MFTMAKSLFLNKKSEETIKDHLSEEYKVVFQILIKSNKNQKNIFVYLLN